MDTKEGIATMERRGTGVFGSKEALAYMVGCEGRRVMIVRVKMEEGVSRWKRAVSVRVSGCMHDDGQTEENDMRQERSTQRHSAENVKEIHKNQ